MRAAYFMLGVLLLPLAMPGAVAWRADGWLIQDVIGGERLSLGDEFGCHGIPDKDVHDDYTVVSECKDYLTSQIDASKWGAEPLSFGLSESFQHESFVNPELEDKFIEEGFHIVGDEVPTVCGNSNDDLCFIGRSGGSLEKNVASISSIEEDISQNGYASLYWEAQIEDLNVRRDPDVLEWIENQDYWFTTWGEWYSSTNLAHEIERTNQSITLEGQPSHRGWEVPGNTHISIPGGLITSITLIQGDGLEELTIDDNHLKEGYRILDESNATLCITEGTIVQVNWTGENTDIIIENGTFNNMTPFMVVGHHTIDLFEWSSPFQDSPLRFTWLIEPQPDVEPTWVLPLLAILIVLAAPVAVSYTLKHDREMNHASEEE